MREEDSGVARQNWGEILDYAQFIGHLLIRRRGKPAAVIISFNDWKKYVEPHLDEEDNQQKGKE